MTFFFVRATKVRRKYLVNIYTHTHTHTICVYEARGAKLCMYMPQAYHKARHFMKILLSDAAFHEESATATMCIRVSRSD